LPFLTSIDANGNGISDVSVLSSATRLQTLELADNSITDVTSLEALTSLQDLNLARNAIVDASPLAALVSLGMLNLQDNQVESIAAFGANELFGYGGRFVLKGNPLDCSAAASTLYTLEARGMQVFSDCQ
jgi:hypothetical protein